MKRQITHHRTRGGGSLSNVLNRETDLGAFGEAITSPETYRGEKDGIGTPLKRGIKHVFYYYKVKMNSFLLT